MNPQFCGKPYMVLAISKKIAEKSAKLQEVWMKLQISLIALIIVILSTAVVFADTGEPQVEETQGFITSTLMQLYGTATETDSIAMAINDGYQAGWHDPAPPMGPGSVIYSSTYSEHTIADQGLVSIAKTMKYDTTGMAAENQYNLVSDRITTFIGSETGRIYSQESLLLDGAGTAALTGSSLLCPFATQNEYDIIPPFCNIVEEGSVVDLTIGTLSTQSSERFIMLASPKTLDEEYDFGMAWPWPVADPGVEANYNVKLTGFGEIASSGSASAFMNAHIQEARGIIVDEELYSYYEAPKAEDLVYSELTTATGEITLFEKTMNYKSQFTGPAGYVIFTRNGQR